MTVTGFIRGPGGQKLYPLSLQVSEKVYAGLLKQAHKLNMPTSVYVESLFLAAYSVRTGKETYDDELEERLIQLLGPMDRAHVENNSLPSKKRKR